MAVPAAASQFFNFSATFSNGYTLTGTTGAGQANFGQAYAVSDILGAGGGFSLNSEQIFPYVGDIRTTGNDDWTLDSLSQTVTFNADGSFFFSDNGNGSRSWYFTTGGEWDFTQSEPQDFFFLAGTASSIGSLWTGDRTWETGGEFVPRNVTNDPGRVESTFINSSVAVVPEINGSGFAYIAFILGALGLWLYSGAARGRQEETPAVA